MKKLLLFALVIAHFSTKAQFSKGQKLVGPSFGFGINNSKEVQQSTSADVTKKTLNISGNLGYSVLKMKNNKKATGWRYGYSITNSKVDNYNSTYTYNDKSTNHYFTVGYANRTFVPIKPKLNFYYELVYAVQAGFGKSERSESNSPNISIYKTNSQSVFAFITPGVTYQLKNNLFIECALNSIGSIGFDRNYSKNANSSPFVNYEDTQFNFSASSSLTANSLLSNFYFSLKWMLK